MNATNAFVANITVDMVVFEDQLTGDVEAEFVFDRNEMTVGAFRDTVLPKWLERNSRADIVVLFYMDNVQLGFQIVDAQ